MPNSTKHLVRGETNTLRLAGVGQAINLRIYRRNHLLGRMQVGQGGLAWIPKGWKESRKRRIPWEVFAVLMKEWPFGGVKKARVKFADGAIWWRAPGKKGTGRKITWDEFVRRMEMPLPKGAGEQPSRTGRPKKGSSEETRPGGPAKPPAGPVPINVPRTRALLRRRGLHHLRFLSHDHEKITLREHGHGRSPVTIEVLINGRCQGVIQSRRYVPRPSCRYPAAKVARELRDIERAPWRRLKEYGRETSHCGICGRELTNPESIERGIGPICAEL